MSTINQPATAPARAQAPMGASSSPARVHVRRRIDAPPEVLFAAWLDAASVATWMRPGSKMHSTARIDPVVGGHFQIDMHEADQVYLHRGTYVEIDPPRRLVFTWASAATGGRDSLVTVEFTPKDGLTEVALTHEQLPEDQVAAHTGGWTAILENLSTASLPGR